VAVVGRPNVGKSSLVNRVLGRRIAVVDEQPGVTRDRREFRADWAGREFLIVDTGGWEVAPSEELVAAISGQAEAALGAADLVLFVVDATTGVSEDDARVARLLRDAPVILVANKVDDAKQEPDVAELWQLGLGEPFAVSALHGRGVGDLLDRVVGRLPELPEGPTEEMKSLAIIGRPNVGKSTLINALLGENRVIAFDQPGTTRDSIEVPFERDGRRYTLIDTAGLRRRGQVFEALEKFSVIKTLQSVDQANVVVLVLDAQAEISDQDAHIAGYVVEKGRALVVAVNKWDGLDDYKRECVKRDLGRRLGFLGFARFHFISALQGSGMPGLLPSIDEAYRAAMTKLSTPRLTRVLIDSVERQQPPRKGLTRPKLRYAHQGGMNPPLIVIHGNALNAVPESYRRYLEGRFREAFSLQGTPLKVQFKTSTNPYLKKH
jgi:GTP-binding protein